MLRTCLPPGYLDYVLTPHDNVDKIQLHVFRNPRHAKISQYRDELHTRVGMLANNFATEFADSQDWAADWANAVKNANEAREEAHNYMGIVSVLNGIVNRPREANMTAAMMLQHAGKIKSALQSRRMSVHPTLLTILDDTVARFSAGR
jgi:hypothetical protein